MKRQYPDWKILPKLVAGLSPPFIICKKAWKRLAINILQGDEERVVSSMMPCRVAVYVKADGKTYISRMNSKLMSKGMNGNVRSTMKSAFVEMEEILSKLVINE